MILLDTSVLSAAFRRRHGAESEAAGALRRMIGADLPVAVPGIALQEIFSGGRSDAAFLRLGDLLDAFPITTADRRDHITGAKIANACRRTSIATSTIDCLITAMAIERDAPLFTLDENFIRMARHCELKLWRPTAHA